MISSEGKIGRVFVLRLEDDDLIPASIEKFAAEKEIRTAYVSLIGCLDQGEVASGPKEGTGIPPKVINIPLDGAHETLAAGFIAPDQEGRPILHIHGALGRAGHTVAGCLRHGVRVWCYSEVVILEMEGIDARRLPDGKSGFTLLTLMTDA